MRRATLELHSLSLLASGERGSATLSASFSDDQYVVINTIDSRTESGNGYTASQPNISVQILAPLRANIATQYQGTNLDNGQSNVSLTLNVDVPL